MEKVSVRGEREGRDRWEIREIKEREEGIRGRGKNTATFLHFFISWRDKKKGE